MTEQARIAEEQYQLNSGETQRRALDRLKGMAEELNTIYDAHCRFPVAPGTILHGIDVSKLDWMTRALVMSKNLATIYALGGKIDPIKESDQ